MAPPPLDTPCVKLINGGKCKAFFAGACRYNHNPKAIDAIRASLHLLKEWQASVKDSNVQDDTLFTRAVSIASSSSIIHSDVIVTLATPAGIARVEEVVKRNIASANEKLFSRRYFKTLLPLISLLTQKTTLSSGLLQEHVRIILDNLADPSICRPLLESVTTYLDLQTGSDHTVQAIKLMRLLLEANTRLLSNAMFSHHLDVVTAHAKDYLHDHVSSEAKRDLAFVKSLMDSAEHPRLIVVADSKLEDENVLPSMDDIFGITSSQLPAPESTDWTSDVTSLVNHQFRLLREDACGPIRDTIAKNIGLQASTPDREDQAKHYKNVRIMDPYFEPAFGMQFVIAIPQPSHLKTIGERKSYWVKSGRLLSDTVVCLDISNTLLHATIIEIGGMRPKYGRQPNKLERANMQKYKRPDRRNVTLHLNPDFAFVLVSPIISSHNDLTNALRLMSYPASGHGATLVECPGVLLPTFKPTLETLQKIQAGLDLPFQRYLAPLRGTVAPSISPPQYSQVDTFQFDFGSVTVKDKALAYVKPKDLAATTARLKTATTLDRSQAGTVMDALSRELALIQGPPGTGKSFVGVTLVQILSQIPLETTGPIVIVCATNHALDQILEKLLAKEPLADHNLLHLTDIDQHHPLERRQLGRSKRARQVAANDQNVAMATLHNIRSPEMLLTWLLQYHPDRAGELLGGANPTKKSSSARIASALSHWLASGQKTTQRPRPLSHLDQLLLVDMTHEERRVTYDYWIGTMTAEVMHDLKIATQQFDEGKAFVTSARDEMKHRILSQARVIGFTTTGFSIRRHILERIKPKILVCEEAGEVTEAHLLACLLPSIEHCILIGDHLQLRPHTTYNLSSDSRTGYAFDVSLLERLVTEKHRGPPALPRSMLKTQRRMAPTISQLIKPLYPGLTDAAPAYGPVLGMKKSVFWFDHSNPESKGGMTGARTSQHNVFEVEMVSALANYLIRHCGRRPEHIAIITPYMGQKLAIIARLKSMGHTIITDADTGAQGPATRAPPRGPKQHGEFPNKLPPPPKPVLRAPPQPTMRVGTIDAFQGEESRIVIVSMVRSNAERNCGFVRSENRINVLLSRAQQGLYIVGNTDTFAKVPFWSRVLKTLVRQDRVGPAFELESIREPGRTRLVSVPGDFPR